MTIYKNPIDNTLHDDMDGEALNLPIWPSGMIALSESEVATILQTQTTAMEAIILSQPNPSGFISGIKSAVGGIIAANTIAQAYPLLFGSIQVSDWTDVTLMIEDALKRNIITATQYDAIKQTALTNNISVVLN